MTPHLPGDSAAFGYPLPDSCRSIPLLERSRRLSWFVTDECFCADDQHYFVRGNIEIPVHGLGPLVFTVWVSISEASCRSMVASWLADGRESTQPPRFGYIQNSIRAYTAPTANLHCNVVARPVGMRPLVVFEDTQAHPIAAEVMNGISPERLDEVRALMASAS